MFCWISKRCVHALPNVGGRVCWYALHNEGGKGVRGPALLPPGGRPRGLDPARVSGAAGAGAGQSGV